jgi:predicted RNase H-like HicB family nuclease
MSGYIDTWAYTVRIERELIDGGVRFAAHVLELPELRVIGSTIDEADQRAQDGIREAFRDYQQKGKRFPRPGQIANG